MTGLTPVLRVFDQSWTAPAIEPWSVRLTAGISSSAARLTRSGTRQAPSRIEYSEWTCRWTKSAWAIAEGQCTPGSRRLSECSLRAGTSSQRTMVEGVPIDLIEFPADDL